MSTLTIILLIIVPWVIYRLIIYYLEEYQDIEMSKMLKSMIFFIADVLIMIIANSLGLK